MNKASIIEKFGLPYVVTPVTFKMGTHKLFAENMAKRFLNSKIVLDACVGAGFNVIPIARVAKKVIAVDKDKSHLNLAKQNIIIAQLNNITFILGDIMNNATFKKIGEIDSAYLDPEWVKGGCRGKCRGHSSTLAHMAPPADKLLKKIETKTKNIALRLPKEFNIRELNKFPPHEIEKSYLDGEFKFYTIYFGNLIKKVGLTEFRVS